MIHSYGCLYQYVSSFVLLGVIPLYTYTAILSSLQLLKTFEIFPIKGIIHKAGITLVYKFFHRNLMYFIFNYYNIVIIVVLICIFQKANDVKQLLT